MYSQGDVFNYEYDGDEYELKVLDNIILESNEYFITEDLDREIYVFLYDEDEEEFSLVDDAEESRAVINYWRKEYLVGSVSDFEDDDYYIENRDFDDNDENYYY